MLHIAHVCTKLSSRYYDILCGISVNEKRHFIIIIIIISWKFSWIICFWMLTYKIQDTLLTEFANGICTVSWNVDYVGLCMWVLVSNLHFRFCVLFVFVVCGNCIGSCVQRLCCSISCRGIDYTYTMWSVSLMVVTVAENYCPRADVLHQPGGCSTQCLDDSQCSSDQKCCRTSCGGYICIPASQQLGLISLFYAFHSIVDVCIKNELKMSRFSQFYSLSRLFKTVSAFVSVYMGFFTWFK